MDTRGYRKDVSTFIQPRVCKRKSSAVLMPVRCVCVIIVGRHTRSLWCWKMMLFILFHLHRPLWQFPQEQVQVARIFVAVASPWCRSALVIIWFQEGIANEMKITVASSCESNFSPHCAHIIVCTLSNNHYWGGGVPAELVTSNSGSMTLRKW